MGLSLTAQALNEILATVASEKIPPPKFDEDYFLRTNFYPGQVEYIKDRTPYKSLFGSKRSGKSSCNSGDLAYCDQTVRTDLPGHLIYASTTLEHAKQLALKRLMQGNKKHDFGYKLNLSKNIIKTNYNTILFVGLKDLKAVYDIQGIRIKKAIIDEPQFIKEPVLKAFIHDVVSGGMMEYEGQGQVSYVGNPFPIHSGFLWEEINNPKVSRHHLNVTDNLHLDQAKIAEFIKEELEKRGETMQTLSNATRRLIFGEWVSDDSNLVIPLTDKNFFKSIPPNLQEQLIPVLGIDLGFDDKCAVAVLLFHKYTGQIWLAREYQQPSLTITPLVNEIKSFLSLYDTRGNNIIDTAGNGKIIAETIKREHSLPMKTAQKQQKMDWVRILQDAIATRKFFVRSDSAFASDARHILFKNHQTELDDDHFHSDIFHAVLYAFRFIRTQLQRETKKTVENDPVKRRLAEIYEEQAKNPVSFI